MERQIQQKFIRGINRRFNVANQDDPTRLYRLENARLQKRGETGQVARIKGFEELTNTPVITGTVYDSVFYDNLLIVLSHPGATDAVIHIFNVDTNTLITTFNFPEEDTGYGELTLLEDTIFITPYNKMLNLYNGTWRMNDFKSTTPLLRLSQNATMDGFLEQEATYWYMAAITYRDNHKTLTCFPQKIKIGAKRFVELNITTPIDLDLGDVQVEIFRKKEEENFFLIDRVRVDAQNDFEYIDTGRPKMRAFSRQNYVWNETEASAAIVRDRMVRGGVTFADREYEPDATVTLDDATDDESLVPDSNFTVYARRRFPDGILSPHVPVDEIIGEEDKTFKINQPTTPDREIGFYMGFNRPFIPSDKTIEFPTLEIYNAVVPSIQTESEDEFEQDRPFDPHVFVGFAQIIRQFHEGNTIRHGIRDLEWGGGVLGFHWFDSNSESPTGFENIMPRYIDIEVVEGVVIKYKRIATDRNDGTVTQGVYQIAWLNGLKEYIATQQFNVQTESVLSGFTMSTQRTNSNFLGIDVRVVGYKDQTDIFPKPYRTESTNNIALEWKNRVYLVLDRESIYNEFNSTEFNNSDVKDSWNSNPPDLSARAILSLLNITYIEDDNPTSVPLTIDGLSHYRWDYEDEVIQPVPDFGLEDSVVYLGSTFGQGEKLYSAGIEKVTNNGFTFWRLPTHAIFETLLLSEELEIFQDHFANLLIWSEPYVLGTGINGIRNFTFTNFKSVSQDFGPIIDIRYINNRLLVFCERGVNMVHVGETLTQQASGEVFVSSAQFLTSDFWLLRNLPAVQKQSIVQYENMLFMSDGRDVWQFIEGFQNITNGAIELDGDVVAAGVDPLNKEYRITDQSQTWAFSIELGEWMGPYTYTDIAPVNYRDRFFAVHDQGIIEHNNGNTFDGSEYETFIESVAIDVQHSAMDKLWRKFLLQLDNIPGEPDQETLDFLYGKDFSNKTAKNLFEVAKKLNLYHIGIHPDEHNSQQLYWGIRTDIEDFVLRAFAYNLLIRNRP